MFRYRALVTLTLGPVAIYLIYLGGWPYFLPIVAVLILASIEYTNMMRRLGWRPARWILIPAVVALAVTAQFPRLHSGHSPALMVALLAAVVYALWAYEARRSETVVADWLALTGGIVLLGWIGSHFLLVRGLDARGTWAMLAMITTWSADSGAYLFGRQFGRHKLSPRLSPNKTVEGFVGGVLFSALLLGVVVRLFYPDFPWLFAGGILLLGAVVSPAGDLAISLLKREAGVKDSGQMLPGHGGALDRIDSLVWSVTLVYYLGQLSV